MGAIGARGRGRRRAAAVGRTVARWSGWPRRRWRFAIGVVTMRRKAARVGVPLTGAPGRRFALSLAAPLVAGAALDARAVDARRVGADAADVAAALRRRRAHRRRVQRGADARARALSFMALGLRRARDAAVMGQRLARRRVRRAAGRVRRAHRAEAWWVAVRRVLIPRAVLRTVRCFVRRCDESGASQMCECESHEDRRAQGTAQCPRKHGNERPRAAARAKQAAAAAARSGHSRSDAAGDSGGAGGERDAGVQRPEETSPARPTATSASTRGELEDAGYVHCDKTFAGRTPRTEYRLSAVGPAGAREVSRSHGRADPGDEEEGARSVLEPGCGPIASIYLICKVLC